MNLCLCSARWTICVHSTDSASQVRSVVRSKVILCGQQCRLLIGCSWLHRTKHVLWLEHSADCSRESCKQNWLSGCSDVIHRLHDCGWDLTWEWAGLKLWLHGKCWKLFILAWNRYELIRSCYIWFLLLKQPLLSFRLMILIRRAREAFRDQVFTHSNKVQSAG